MNLKEKILKQFVEKFANPTAKYLGNDFAEYPEANIKDATDFLSSALSEVEQVKDNEWRKILNSGKTMYEMGKKEGAEAARKEIESKILYDVRRYTAPNSFLEEGVPMILLSRTEILSLLREDSKR